MQFNTDLTNMPRERVIMAWIGEADWPEAIKWEAFDEESKAQTGRDGCWIHAESLISELGDDIPEVAILGWCDLPEKPQKAEAA